MTPMSHERRMCKFGVSAKYEYDGIAHWATRVTSEGEVCPNSKRTNLEPLMPTASLVPYIDVSVDGHLARFARY